ncbi:Glycerol-3-phosphate dehydrogenase [Ketogulonicigenium robustum]|uniref:Glycerol-3-phosphate dehydrogenase n=1 Tax=Ketogulonicigenium robustum TaxID=92947 RepID=A0A1W6NX22_9RHOB|nr:hypothetical protein [Ketogulonicigenium robustum]ARO13557.1 Glycerol-3-phosphate dehydrogenase [Ketogulonicigenium robustum]
MPEIRPNQSNDILAAIRKLVDGALDDAAADAGAGVTAPLLLTPSLRVDAPVDAPVNVPFHGRAPQFGAGEDAAADRPAHQAPVAPTLPDDAALRQLVAEVLRAELQGELGERITRNVRKLVHREVLRANGGRDLD